MNFKSSLSLFLTATFILGYGQKVSLEKFQSESDTIKRKASLVERMNSDSSQLSQGIKLNFIKELTGADENSFTPTLKYGIGMVLETIYQQVPKEQGLHKEANSRYNFQPAAFKIGFLHTDMDISPKLSASMTWNLHSSKISDAFIKYNFNPLLNLQIGRFKGAGNRAANETSAYDLDLADFTYTSENQSAAQGAPDLRHYGINVSGNVKNFVRYAFFLHNSDSNRDRYWSSFNDGPSEGQGNHGLEFKSWDASLRFFPVKNVEFGGHMGSVNLPGMGFKQAWAYSGFLYYINPKKYKFKFDYGTFKNVRFTSVDENGNTIFVSPNNLDYTKHDFVKVNKLGYSFLAGFNITPKIEPVARFEYFNQGNKDISGFNYEKLYLYTAGVNFYLYPNSPRMAKLTAFYQHRAESGGPSISNDWFGLSYQIVLYNNTKGVF